MVGAACAGLFWTATAAEPGAPPFSVGEKLHYRIFWGPLPVGDATLEVRGLTNVDGHECYHFVAAARTVGIGRALFPMNSHTESWTDQKEFFSRRFHQDRREGKHVSRRQTTFDYARSESVTHNLENGREKRTRLDGPVQDIISALYYARTQPLTLHREHQFVVNAGGDHHTVRLRPDQRRQLTIRPVGTVPALRIEPDPPLTVVAAHNGRMWFWVSDDNRRLPLVLHSTMSIGSAKLVLYQVDQPARPQYTARPVPPTAN